MEGHRAKDALGCSRYICVSAKYNKGYVDIFNAALQAVYKANLRNTAESNRESNRISRASSKTKSQACCCTLF